MMNLFMFNFIFEPIKRKPGIPFQNIIEQGNILVLPNFFIQTMVDSNERFLVLTDENMRRRLRQLTLEFLIQWLWIFEELVVL